MIGLTSMSLSQASHAVEKKTSNNAPTKKEMNALEIESLSDADIMNEAFSFHNVEKTSLYTRNKLFAGSSLLAKTKA